MYEGFLAVLMRFHLVLLLEDIANRLHSSTISRSLATWITILIVEMRSIFQQLHTNVKFSKASISGNHDAFLSTLPGCRSSSAAHLLPQPLRCELNSPDSKDSNMTSHSQQPFLEQ